jgi:hypothetical protein
MTGASTDPTELDAAILGVYRGRLEEFVARRDALAKQLRASRRREDAERVKALRKPSRTAWALDQVVLEDPAPVERLADAIRAARGEAPTRPTQDDVRNAVRGVAEAAARAAIRGGNPVESSALVAALRAVMGDAAAFAELRAGRLIEIPEGGGLDLLGVAAVGAPPSPAAAAPTTKPERRGGEARAVQAGLRRAETLLAEARARARAADRAALRAQDRLDAAEQQLRRAQEVTDERRTELERARQDATAAAAEVADAERGIADLRERPG